MKSARPSNTQLSDLVKSHQRSSPFSKPSRRDPSHTLGGAHIQNQASQTIQPTKSEHCIVSPLLPTNPAPRILPYTWWPHPPVAWISHTSSPHTCPLHKYEELLVSIIFELRTAESNSTIRWLQVKNRELLIQHKFCSLVSPPDTIKSFIPEEWPLLKMNINTTATVTTIKNKEKSMEFMLLQVFCTIQSDRERITKAACSMDNLQSASIAFSFVFGVGTFLVP